MAFEREAISQTTTSTPHQMPGVMREDRVVDPYANGGVRLAKAAASAAAKTGAIGQPDKNSDPAVPGTPAETVTLSPQVAALARKEQAFRQREQLQKQEKVAIEKERAEFAELKAMKEALTTGDYSKLDGIVPYEKFTEWKVAQLQGSDPTQTALKEVKTELDSIKKAQADDISKRFDAAVEDRRKAVKALAETPEFAPLKKGGDKVVEAAVQHILDTWEHEGIEISPEQAAKEVKQVLKERLDWHKALFEEANADPAPADGKALPPLKAAAKTITNNMNASAITRPNKSFQGMSDSERYAEARRRAEEKLKAQGR